MRLIDADNFMEFMGTLKGAGAKHVSFDDLRKFINNQPTAYDVDKVVEHLEEKREKHRKDAHAQMYKHKHEDWAQYLDGMQCGIRDSIEIVKSGGMD